MYFIAIVLPASLNEKILRLKNFMYAQYKCEVGLKSPAHITLIPPFWMKQGKEALLLKDADTIAGNCVPFIARTKNFSAFKPRTIFIDVEKNENLFTVKETAEHFFKSSEYKIKIDTRPFHPHITIATRDLFKKDFFDAWPKFENEKFEEEWEVKSLSVLRHNKKNWDVVQTSQFIYRE
jgi:2'-5' RNA ligase